MAIIERNPPHNPRLFEYDDYLPYIDYSKNGMWGLKELKAATEYVCGGIRGLYWGYAQKLKRMNQKIHASLDTPSSVLEQQLTLPVMNYNLKYLNDANIKDFKRSTVVKLVETKDYQLSYETIVRHLGPVRYKKIRQSLVTEFLV